LYKIVIMQLTVDLNIDQLIQVIKKLPAHQKSRIKAELTDTETEKKQIEKTEFQKFLLKGPVMSDLHYKQFKENRKKMNQWRTL
jgi:hypothetical protein